MVIQDMKSRTFETSANPNSKSISDYQLCREKRIKENMERMAKLGLFHLSSKLNSHVSSKRQKRTFQKTTTPTLDSSSPPRRSSRLQNSPPKSYSDSSDSENSSDEKRLVRVKKCGETWVGTGSCRPEIYTEEDEKLLGSCESPWTLGIDGIGLDGRRVYDQVRGKTCHQCRQKTLGHHTNCCECNPLVQGQFCGDCLYIRYGENVLEANQNPNWVCPVCRGICNCSLCRHAKGWAPTGLIYRKISKLGYKSVAHYLIQTQRAESLTESEQEPVIKLDTEVFAGRKEEENLQDMSDDATPRPLHKEITLYYVRRRYKKTKDIKSDSSGGKKDELNYTVNKSGVVLEVGLVSVGKKRKRGDSGVVEKSTFALADYY